MESIVILLGDGYLMTKKLKIKHLPVAILIATLLFSGCNEGAVDSSVFSDTSSYQIDSQGISDDVMLESITPETVLLNINEEGVSVMTGTLLPDVTLNARLYCKRDINNPGAGRIDEARIRAFGLGDLDVLIQEDWTMISEMSESLMHYDTSIAYDAGYYEYLNDAGDTIVLSNTYRGLSVENSWWRSPERSPWYSTEYAWQSDDFEFMTAEEAFALWREQLLTLDVELSSTYKVDRVPHNVFDAYYRLNILFGEDIPNIEWSSENDAYYLMGSQDWNGLSVISDGVSNTFNGEDLDGDEYKGILFNDLDVIISSQGIQLLNCYYIFELETVGQEKPLISVWDALETLRAQIMNPIYEHEILYSLSLKPNNIVIDQIELCYVPVRQSRLGVAEDSLYDMIPCWSFRLTGINENGMEEQHVCLVNAISNEYILLTNVSVDF